MKIALQIIGLILVGFLIGGLISLSIMLLIDNVVKTILGG